ncbi:SAV_6107 family HEPN domain-containing protein, partial [Cellulosimicrobium funkei]|uniref:SAV_6107 family HEPN domain-containing protein n=2 Tax=Cellulosimicrobium TaxID=157920 RepID=UPI003F90649C
MSNEAGARAQVVVPAEVRRLLARADAELVAAALAQDAGERFVHAHLGALRAAAAVVALRARPVRRGRARSVWEQLADAEP